jgi:hypothetical protein
MTAPPFWRTGRKVAGHTSRQDGLSKRVGWVERSETHQIRAGMARIPTPV